MRITFLSGLPKILQKEGERSTNEGLSMVQMMNSKSGSKRDMLQKSTSQQHIPNRPSQPSLSSSKSTTSLIKSDDSDKYKECTVKSSMIHYMMIYQIDKVDEDFDRLQEDLVLKLVVDEETPKTTQTSTNFDVAGVQPPPNLVPPSQEKWYYQDPQGTRQGPFPNVEMAEWYKAGYFSNQLHVMRECDERYFLLGELINMCGGENPFLSNIRFPLLKNEAAKLPDDVLPYQFLSQMAFKQQISMRNLAEPWSALTLQQQELAAQRLLLQQQQQLPHDLQFMQQSTPSNPLMYMINQMQQSNKLPGSVLVDKPSSSVPNQLDPLLVQMGNMHSLQNRIQTPGLHNHLPTGVPTNLSSSLPPDGLGSTLPSLQTPPIPTGGISSLPSIHGSLPSGLPGSVNVNRPTSHGSIDQLPPNQDNDPITNFLKQFQQQRQLPLDSLWQKQNQFNVAPPVSTPTQWTQQPETPLSMWDLQTPATSVPSEVQAVPIEKPNQQEKELRPKEEVSQKELKKRKEQEEKQAKKEADERRKQEQKKQEAEKKAAEEKKKKEEEKIRKEIEKAKKEAEEKRLRELEEKRRLKEQRKAEEEARKKSEELKRQEEEKIRRENKEREEKKQAEAARLAQSQAARAASKTAPWCQSNFTQGVNLTDIQKAEKEKRAQEAALQLQKQQLQEQQQQQLEKAGGIQLSWAKKPVEPRKVKSFAEIQAEEQERLAKLTAEARLAAQLKEKEAPVSVSSGNIWNGQSLTWANASSTSQWSSNSVSKSNSTSAMTTTKQQQKQSKSKPKKEESPKSVNNNNNQTKDEFTDWCYKTLSNISADVDIPTFVTFLRDIESAYDVRDYCKEYLGESPATQQFASNFLEKRRSFKPKNNAHKDDMCSPAPAITPSMQHNTEFQEVKGKNKKNKKSKMLKVDSRILGFNVTSAPDRINVGDRDYGDNS
ncbi:PERQ amino acid-rich with GYF domain-containing protein 2 [Asbolus verrucosus]|uniref:PERQ amino acid-rich with GYF domain-containing protein 2 n=1 Tax=Asbolus verrucosus TaxID=1661398 RepID=A0A482VI54_ASBVE|nr:PERQ amino acid-rich with GYF domain-containing protein 2 [Asbolus verrucosus]